MNPWLGVPLEDYEGHMGPAGVQQLSALADLFARALAVAKPESVAIPGIAGGNGLDRIDRTVTRRVVGVDINARYLEAVRERYRALAGLELHCLDLSREPAPVAPVDLVHAALIFEHAGAGRCLDSALGLVKPGGRFSVVLQLPSASEVPVSPSQYASIEAVRENFRLFDPAEFCAIVESRGFRRDEETRVPLTQGKSFWMGIFRSSECRALPPPGL